MAVDDQTYFQHMLEAAQIALQFAAGCARSDLDHDKMRVFAIIRAIEIVGEAASKVTQESRNAYPQIPWVAIVGMRNRLIHAYFAVDLDQVWETTQNDLPLLIAELKQILA